MTRPQRPNAEELTRRMLLVEDPVEMKTDPGTEILVGTTPEEDAAELLHRNDARHEHADTHRDHRVHVTGLGEVATPVPRRRR